MNCASKAHNKTTIVPPHLLHTNVSSWQATADSGQVLSEADGSNDSFLDCASSSATKNIPVQQVRHSAFR
jgi:hypothetical protein